MSTDSSTDKGTDRTPAQPQDGEAQESRGPEEIQAEIEQTRQHLGETVDALSSKLDVKTRAKEKAAATRRQAVDQAQEARRRVTDAATDDQGSLKPAVPAGAAGVAAVLVVVGVLVWRRRR